MSIWAYVLSSRHTRLQPHANRKLFPLQNFFYDDPKFPCFSSWIINNLIQTECNRFRLLDAIIYTTLANITVNIKLCLHEIESIHSTSCRLSLVIRFVYIENFQLSCKHNKENEHERFEHSVVFHGNMTLHYI